MGRIGGNCMVSGVDVIDPFQKQILTKVKCGGVIIIINDVHNY